MVWLAVNTTAISGTKYFGMSSEGRVKINPPPSHIHPSLQTKANFLCPINHSPSPQDGVIPMILNLATVKSFLLNPKELLFKYQHTKKKKKKSRNWKHTHTHTHTHTETSVADHHAVLEDELDHVLLQSHEEVFTGVVHEGHHQLQDACHVVQHQVVTLGLQRTHIHMLLNKQVPQPVLCLVLLKTRLNQRLECLFTASAEQRHDSLQGQLLQAKLQLSAPSPFWGGWVPYSQTYSQSTK